MRVEELAEELADFWFSAIAEAEWDRRLQILTEIHLQLRADIESREEYDALSPLFVASVIQRLGAPAVSNEAQAQVYGYSRDPRHRAAVDAWRYGSSATESAPSDGVAGSSERRRWPRMMVDALSEMWIRGRPAPCRLIDLSQGGARIAVLRDTPTPEPGTSVRVAVPKAGLRDAIVVFANSMAIGLRFDTPTEAV